MTRVVGSAELHHVARLCKEAGASMQKELYSGINRPVKPFRAAVRRNVDEVMPHRGGYQAIMSRAMQVKVSSRLLSSAAIITLVGTAKGKTEKRDVQALDDGELRHPVYGRRKRWAVTSIRPGFFTEPGKRMVNDIVKEIGDVIDRIADKIEKG